MRVPELKQAHERQMANPQYRFERPQDIIAFIEEKKPGNMVKATLDMTVLSVTEKELCLHIMLFAGSADDFNERVRLLKELDEDERAQFVFCLSLWKAKKQARTHVTGDDYVPSKSYIFSDVKDIHMYYNVAQGSIQASFAVVTESDEQRIKSKDTKDSDARS